MNKKILNKNNTENTIVNVVFRYLNENCECIGVLIKEEKDSIRIVFNAKNDKATDYLDIEKINIININILDISDIPKL